MAKMPQSSCVRLIDLLSVSPETTLSFFQLFVAVSLTSLTSINAANTQRRGPVSWTPGKGSIVLNS